MLSTKKISKHLINNCVPHIEMPLDINAFRADRGGDPEKIRESQRRRFKNPDVVDEIIAKDNEWRFLTGSIDNFKKEKNAIQKQVSVKMKAKEECPDLLAKIKEVNESIERAEKQQEETGEWIRKKINTIGNIVDPTVPVSIDEANNLVISTWGTCRSPEGLLNHHDLLWRIGGYEPERGVGVAGHRAYFLKDVGVLLNQAFINYGISFLRKRNYSVLQPPYFMKASVMAGVAQLEEFDEALYKVSGDNDGEDKYLIATSEQPICGYHMGEWLNEKDLPLRYNPKCIYMDIYIYPSVHLLPVSYIPFYNPMYLSFLFHSLLFLCIHFLPVGIAVSPHASEKRREHTVKIPGVFSEYINSRRLSSLWCVILI